MTLHTALRTNVPWHRWDWQTRLEDPLCHHQRSQSPTTPSSLQDRNLACCMGLCVLFHHHSTGDCMFFYKGRYTDHRTFSLVVNTIETVSPLGFSLLQWWQSMCRYPNLLAHLEIMKGRQLSSQQRYFLKYFTLNLMLFLWMHPNKTGGIHSHHVCIFLLSWSGTQNTELCKVYGLYKYRDVMHSLIWWQRSIISAT